MTERTIKAELRGGPLDGQCHTVKHGAETILLAIEPTDLSVGCYVYGRGLTADGGSTYGFAYLGSKRGYVMDSVIQCSHKTA